jgi:hypothetical protein
VQRDLGTVEHPEQFGLVGMQPREQPVQGDETGSTLKDAIKPRPQFGPAAPGRPPVNRPGFPGGSNSCEDGAMTKRTPPFSPEVRERAV